MPNEEEQPKPWDIETTPEQDKTYSDSLEAWDDHSWWTSYLAAQKLVWWIKNAVYPQLDIHIIDIMLLLQYGPDPYWIVEYSHTNHGVKKYIIVRGERNDFFRFSPAKAVKMKYPPRTTL